MNSLLKNLEYKIIVILPFIKYFAAGFFIYVNSLISIIFSIKILSKNSLKIKINYIFILLVAGILISLNVTIYNLIFNKYISFSNKALVTQLGFLIQFSIIILLVNNNYSQIIIEKLYQFIKDNILLLSIINFYANISRITLDYQGSTSWPALITFYTALYDKNINGRMKLLVIFLNISAIIISSKRATICALLLTFIIYLFSKFKEINNIMFNLISKFKIKKRVLILILIFAIIVLFLLSNIEYISENLRKLNTTIEIIKGSSNLSDELQVTVLTGGRNREWNQLLQSLNLDLAQLLIKSLTVGIGIGWQNNVSKAATVHNSFLLISLLGGLPLLLLTFRIIYISILNIIKFNTFKIYNNSFIESVSIISLSLAIDAFFSSNFAASYLALFLFAAPISYQEKNR